MLRLYNFSVRWVIFINDIVCLFACGFQVNICWCDHEKSEKVHLQNNETLFLLFFSLFHTVSWSWWEADDSVDRGTWYLYSPPKHPHITGDPLKRMVRRSHPHHTHACAYATLNCLSSPNYVHRSSFHLFCTFHSTHQGSEWRYCWNHPGKEERVFHFLFLHQSLWWKIELSGTHTKHSKGFFFSDWQHYQKQIYAYYAYPSTSQIV